MNEQFQENFQKQIFARLSNSFVLLARKYFYPLQNELERTKNILRQETTKFLSRKMTIF